MVGLGRLELPTSPLSGVRSNQTELQAPLKTHFKAVCVDLRKTTTIFKEVIQPQVPLRLPCYDFTPVIDHTVANALPKVKLSASGATHSHGVTGGVYKARERIHRDILIHDTSDSDFTESSCRLRSGLREVL